MWADKTQGGALSRTGVFQWLDRESEHTQTDTDAGVDQIQLCFSSLRDKDTPEPIDLSLCWSDFLALLEQQWSDFAVFVVLTKHTVPSPLCNMQHSSPSAFSLSASSCPSDPPVAQALSGWHVFRVQHIGQQVFSFLGSEDLLECVRTCRDWRITLCHEALEPAWRREVGERQTDRQTEAERQRCRQRDSE